MSLARLNHWIEHTPFNPAQAGAPRFAVRTDAPEPSIKRDYWLSVGEAESSGGW